MGDPAPELLAELRLIREALERIADRDAKPARPTRKRPPPKRRLSDEQILRRVDRKLHEAGAMSKDRRG